MGIVQEIRFQREGGCSNTARHNGENERHGDRDAVPGVYEENNKPH